MTAADRLDEIEARANAATKGPWTRWKHPLGTKTMDFVSAPSLRNDDAIPFGVADDLLGRDAEFIAAARQDVPWLVDLARRQHKALVEALAILNGDPGYAYGDVRDADRALRNVIEENL